MPDLTRTASIYVSVCAARTLSRSYKTDFPNMCVFCINMTSLQLKHDASSAQKWRVIDPNMAHRGPHLPAI